VHKLTFFATLIQWPANYSNERVADLLMAWPRFKNFGALREPSINLPLFRSDSSPDIMNNNKLFSRTREYFAACQNFDLFRKMSKIDTLNYRDNYQDKYE
jgi:hypothetical protein